MNGGQIKVPKYLFHWGSESGLARMAQQNKNSKQLPLMEDSGSIVTQEFPDLAYRPLLFTWSHPTAAMAVNVTEDPDMPGEIYARSKGGRPPSLLIIKPKPNAKIGFVISKLEGHQPIKFDGIDLLLHYKMGEYGIHFREWIILNSNAIESFTASAAEVPEEVKREMFRSTEPGAELQEGEKFILKNSDEPTAAAMVTKAQSPEFKRPLVQQFFEMKNSKIPKIFLNPLTEQERSCRDVFFL
ncbi:MAG: hypothetical protein ACXVCD_17235 [Pseudobdellovibrionaceae bacterium]